jgi:serine/threonine protein kinase/tetratricopeptide (TPR) repeat protein
MTVLPESHECTVGEQTLPLPPREAAHIEYGPYRLLHRLSAGGMGEVFLAEDTRLDRKVALKMLLEEFTQDASRVHRFVQEAKAASALNHPNIITIFDMDEANGKHYMATEYIEGQTLRQRMATPVPIPTALDVGVQIASALKAAHAAGIIHRDIKPENIMLRPDGLVKVLDFGIAKLVERPTLAAPAESERREATATDQYATHFDPSLSSSGVTVEGTAAGVILGTVTYMSPEQLRGQKLDARTDIFSLGVLLYEVIAGAPPFIAETKADRIAAILAIEPVPLADHRPDAPPELEAIVGKALRKDRDLRYQNTNEMLRDLEALKEELEFKAKLRQSGQSQPLDRRTLVNIFGWPWRRSLTVGIAAIVLAAAIIAAGLYGFSRHTAPLDDASMVVLADFTNTTGDSIFDDTLRQGLVAQLEQSPFLKLLSADAIAQTLALMSKPADSRLSYQLAREVGQRTGSQATIEGSISGFDGRYELRLKAIDCRNEGVLAEVKATAAGKEQVLPELGRAAAKLREALGESLASVEKYSVPAEHVTTISLEALQAYSLGYRMMYLSADYKGAAPFLDKAIDLDPNFAMAYALLATNYGTNRDSIRAAENAGKAFELRQRVSQRERFYIEAAYEYYVTNNLESTRRIYEEWAATYPHDDIPQTNLGNIYSTLGDYEKALAAYQQSLRLNPDSGVGYGNLLNTYIKLDRLDEAKATIQDAQARSLDFLDIHRGLYLICFLQNDAAGMAREASLMIGNPAWAYQGLYLEAEAAARGGQFSRERDLARRSVEDLRHTDRSELAARHMALAALREALAGNSAMAKRLVGEALNISESKYAQATSAIVLGLTGDAARAASMADDLAQRFPEDTTMQFCYLPMARGAVAMQSGDAAKAIDAFNASAPYELGSFGYVLLYPIYLRGEAYLASRDGAAAAAEFQKILDHPGLIGNEPVGALAHLGLGRAYTIAGDFNHAKTAYQDFLVLWKNADPDIPILKQARAEYTQLEQRTGRRTAPSTNPDQAASGA